MFSITIPAFALYFLIAASRRESLGFLLCGVITLYLGRFFYGSIQAITCSMALSFLGLSWGIGLLNLFGQFQKNKKFSKIDLQNLPSLHFACTSTLFIGWFLYFESWSAGISVEFNFARFISALILPIFFFLVLKFFLKTKKIPVDNEISESAAGRFAFDQINRSVKASTPLG